MTKTVLLSLSLLSQTALLFLPPSRLLADDSSGLLNRGAGQTDIMDIYGPLPLPDSPPILFFVLAAGGAILLAGLLLLVLRRRRTARTSGPGPAETALHALQEARRAASDHGDTRRYADELCRILRRYIEASCRLRTTRMTSREFLARLSADRSVPASLVRMTGNLESFLALCDRVKFGGCMPAGETCEAMAQTVRSCIDSLSASSGREGG